MIEVLELCECALQKKPVYHLEGTESVDDMIQEYKVIRFSISNGSEPEIVLVNSKDITTVNVNVSFNPHFWFANFYDAKKALLAIMNKISNKCWLKSVPTV